MKFLMLVRVHPDADHAADSAESTTEDPELTAWVERGTTTGMRLEGHRLQETTDATTVRVRDGKTLVTDGPFAEFKEHIAGYDLLEAPTLADAVAFAQDHPAARFGAIEVREVWEDFEQPRDSRNTSLPDSAGQHGKADAQHLVERPRQYLLLHAANTTGTATPAELATAPTRWIEEMDGRKVTRSWGRLRPAGETTTATVRMRAEKPLLTHGPYAELSEQVAGFDLIEVADLDEAIEIAAKHPTARHGAVEVRPLWEP